MAQGKETWPTTAPKEFAGGLTVSGGTLTAVNVVASGTVTATESLTTSNVGTAGTGFTATERGNGRSHSTTLAVSGAFGAIAGGAGNPATASGIA